MGFDEESKFCQDIKCKEQCGKAPLEQNELSFCSHLKLKLVCEIDRWL
jgi:hypothetical protein